MASTHVFTVGYSDDFKPTMRAFRAAVKKRDKSVSEVVRKLIERYVEASR